MKCKSTEISSLEPLKVIRNLHLKTCQELNLPKETVAEIEALLEQLQQLLTGISLMQVRRTKRSIARSYASLRLPALRARRH